MHFVPKLFQVCSCPSLPLTELMKKERAWTWTAAEQKAFDTLKHAFTTAPVVRHYDLSRKTVLKTDASDYAMAGILSQHFDDGLHPIAFFSRKFRAAEFNYNTHNKELLAIIESLKAWRHFAQGSAHPLEIHTDHKNLEYFMTTKDLNRRQVRWAHFLADFNFTLHHRPGRFNKADPLLRRPQDALGTGDEELQQQCLLPNHLFATIASRYARVHPDLRQQIMDAYPEDPFYRSYEEWRVDNSLARGEYPKGFPPHEKRNKAKPDAPGTPIVEPNDNSEVAQGFHILLSSGRKKKFETRSGDIISSRNWTEVAFFAKVSIRWHKTVCRWVSKSSCRQVLFWVMVCRCRLCRSIQIKLRLCHSIECLINVCVNIKLGCGFAVSIEIRLRLCHNIPIRL